MILASDRRGWRKVLFLARSRAPEPVTPDCIQSKSLCFSSLPPLSLLSQKPSRQGFLSHTLTCIPIKEFLLQEPCPQHPFSELVACPCVSWKLWLPSASLAVHEMYLLCREGIFFLCSFYTPDAPGLGDCQSILRLSVSSPIILNFPHPEFQAVLPLPFLVVWVDFSALACSDLPREPSASQWALCFHWLVLLFLQEYFSVLVHPLKSCLTRLCYLFP